MSVGIKDKGGKPGVPSAEPKFPSVEGWIAPMAQDGVVGRIGSACLTNHPGLRPPLHRGELRLCREPNSMAAAGCKSTRGRLCRRS